jgi:hypothetical protein
MSVICAKRTSITRKLATTLALLLAVPMPALAQTGVRGGDLYLLAGTPNPHSPAAYPVSLYTVDPLHKLKLVRKIVPAGDTQAYLSGLAKGLYAVRDDMGAKIYVAYPHQNPTTISVIHKERPTMNDEVVFNPENATVLRPNFGIVSGDGRESYLLCTLLRGIGDYPLLSVAGDAPSKGARIGQIDWSMFSSFQFQGAPGGPVGPGHVILGYIKDNHVRLVAEPGPGPLTMGPDLDSTPPFPLEDSSGPVYIAVASARYFVFTPVAKQTPGGRNTLYVHDRKLNTWKKLTSSSTSPWARRVFGTWLATIVEVWHPGEEVGENPGTENQRDWDSPLLPNVRSSYAFWAGRRTSIPGTLLLDNLEDGRRITLDTGQEDSEILTVSDDGLVLYRVNDSIFSAQIAGDKLAKPSLVVKDEDVPEVHWVFWSLPATNPGTQPSPSR